MSVRLDIRYSINDEVIPRFHHYENFNKGGKLITCYEYVHKNMTLDFEITKTDDEITKGIFIVYKKVNNFNFKMCEEEKYFRFYTEFINYFQDLCNRNEIVLPENTFNHYKEIYLLQESKLFSNL